MIVLLKNWLVFYFFCVKQKTFLKKKKKKTKERMSENKNEREFSPEPAPEEKLVVLIADKLSPAVESSLAKYCKVVSDPGLKGPALVAALEKVQPSILIVRSTEVTKEHLKAGHDLSLVIRAGAGVNTIDVAEASRRGIFVANCPGKNSIAVAELTIGHLINLDRRIADNVKDIREGKWNKKEYGKANGLCSRRLAVIGLGAIGTEVVTRALSFGMDVVGWNRDFSPQKAQKMGVIYADTIVDACRGADALTIHLALCPDTKDMINKDALSVLKDGALVINTARGGILNEKDMIEMIQKKHLRFGLDVMNNEPEATSKEFKDTAISSNPNIYVTHHIGASTEQAEEAVGEEVLNIVRDYTKKAHVPNCVNLEDQSPAKYSLTIRHQDKFGVLAKCLDIISLERINVQEMNNSVFKGAESCCCKIEVDEKPSPKCIQTLQAIPEVYYVGCVAKKT
ncbi:D-isomer specific 2-hydroxyacid dehydrogenase NAD-binding protein [Reticulomyxa filosa]|uniref:D-isomer specific 2-hydroxyacid dehydrogenase NAD-binding protein n=1 Tax=Reticulomyxa filosa TaxID=46433 RepID=X6NSN9_RETFI|nr:D-isomer specific 2-hydroxyacid dehydrogenase NAD-binding protein [Reticulomyxa filosa]|eukprot:ETO29011.1 D-isomer specific 2-hydroxyacid dehydrogenase NAD-binding protein [Reticulomyxa filosa]